MPEGGSFRLRKSLYATLRSTDSEPYEFKFTGGAKQDFVSSSARTRRICFLPIVPNVHETPPSTASLVRANHRARIWLQRQGAQARGHGTREEDKMHCIYHYQSTLTIVQRSWIQGSIEFHLAQSKTVMLFLLPTTARYCRPNSLGYKRWVNSAPERSVIEQAGGKESVGWVNGHVLLELTYKSPQQVWKSLSQRNTGAQRARYGPDQ